MNYPTTQSFRHFKNKCVCCEESGKEMSKEHFFPQWLLKMTNTEQDLFSSPYGKIPGISFTVPLCKECNSLLGTELEAPGSKIFTSIENGDGFNDYEAELLTRWIWKINGMLYWSICNETWKYGYITLKQRVLSNIEQPRNRISIAISLIEDAEEDRGCAPVGLDALTLYSNIYSVGVFSKICIVIFWSGFAYYFDDKKWTIYELSNTPMVLNPNYKIKPKTGFKTNSEAVSYIKHNFGDRWGIYDAHEKQVLYLKAMGIVR